MTKTDQNLSKITTMPPNIAILGDVGQSSTSYVDLVNMCWLNADQNFLVPKPFDKVSQSRFLVQYLKNSQF